MIILADHNLQSTWQEIDAVAQANKNGVILQTTKQAQKTSSMTQPVGVDAEGRLWTTPDGSSPGGGAGGTNAAIWYTNVAPTNNIFVKADLVGPEGAVPAPGHMVVSGYNGRAYFIVDANETIVALADYTVQINGNPGATGSPYVLYTEQNLTEDQKAQARENIGAVNEDYVEQAIADATGGVNLSEYELVGDTPQYLSGADTRYNIVLDIKEETAVSVVSDTVAEMASGTNVNFSKCEETTENGVHTLTCNSAAAWYQVKKTFTLHNLVAGEKYNALLDFVTSDRSGYPGLFQILDAAGNTVISEMFYNATNINTFSFTAPDTEVIVNLYPVTSEHTPEVGMYVQYRDIWINKSDAKEVRTDVYKFSITTSEQLQLSDIGGGVTITATLAAKVYTQVVEGDAPDGPLAGMTCVCFGDSITGNYTNPFDYPSIIARKTGMEVINGGFGGCRMAQHPSENYTAFSMCNLADSVASGNWAVQDAAVESVESANAAEHMAALKEVDWSTVDYITILYGTNDFTGGVPIGEHDGSLSTFQFKGALRHSIETILTAYPKIRIVLLTPIYRFWNENGTVTDSDSYEISGLKLIDYVEAVTEIANEYKLPVFNLYNSLGINKLNRTIFLADGVHPNESGIERIGDSISARLIAI